MLTIKEENRTDLYQLSLGVIESAGYEYYPLGAASDPHGAEQLFD